MPIVRRYHWKDFGTADLVAAKGDQLVSVCLPARDEAATVGAIVEMASAVPVVDEVLVVDDGSLDRTAAVAVAAGATVLATTRRGKGEAVAVAVEAAKGDLLVFIDADLRSFHPGYVTGLLGPLLLDRSIAFVKAFYERLKGGVAGEGGRVTELVARPLLSLLFPHLEGVLQPLAGEFATRRQVIDGLALEPGWGVDLGLLIDVAERHGARSIAQVDLDERVHRNRPLAELRPQAREVLDAGLRRAGVNQ